MGHENLFEDLLDDVQSIENDSASMVQDDGDSCWTDDKTAIYGYTVIFNFNLIKKKRFRMNSDEVMCGRFCDDLLAFLKDNPTVERFSLPYLELKERLNDMKFNVVKIGISFSTNSYYRILIFLLDVQRHFLNAIYANKNGLLVDFLIYDENDSDILTSFVNSSIKNNIIFQPVSKKIIQAGSLLSNTSLEIINQRSYHSLYKLCGYIVNKKILGDKLDKVILRLSKNLGRTSQ